MAKFKSIAIMIFSLAVILSVVALTVPDPRITTTSQNFIKALITAGEPEKYCCGEVLFQVKNSQLKPAESIDIKTMVTENTRNYAKVYIVAEMKLKDGVDVGFYEAELLKQDQWKVYSLKETIPQIMSFDLPVTVNVDYTFKKCVEDLSVGNTELLAGPAKTAYKVQTGVKGEITDLQTKILYNNKLVIAEHSYKYDGRPVKVLARYFKTTEGYKIVTIQAL